jgi:hypothetical protein
VSGERASVASVYTSQLSSYVSAGKNFLIKVRHFGTLTDTRLLGPGQSKQVHFPKHPDGDSLSKETDERSAYDAPAW